MTNSPNGTGDQLLRQAITLYRDDTSATLNFTPCLIKLLDGEHCRTLSEMLFKVGSDWEIRIAQPDLYHQLPTRPGLYMFVWNPVFKLTAAIEPKIRSFPWILYIGQTGAGPSNNTLRKRYKNEYAKHINGNPGDLFAHDAPANRSERISRYLGLRPLEYWWKEMGDKDPISMLEKALVTLFQPPLNSQHNHGRIPVRRGKSTGAFTER